MIEPKVEKAMPYDLPVLNQISVQSKMYWGYPLDWILHWIDSLRVDQQYLTENHVFKLTVDKIIGFCALVKEEDYYEITHLWILPEFIGKGYGKKLLWETLRLVVKEKSEIVVEADPNAEKFYECQGFRTFDKKESFPPGRFLPMMKRIFPE